MIYGTVLALLLYFYVQGNYVPRNYGVLDGKEINWDSYTSYAAASVILFAGVVIVCLIGCLKMKNKIYSAGRMVCMILILLQFATLGILYVQSNMQKENEKNNIVVTKESMFELSQNKNLFVFILDTFDSCYMKELLNGENGKHFERMLENFTYYPDTLGMYPTTKGALPQILTGIAYENEKPYSDYVKDAYKDNPIYSLLKENRYSVGVYTDPIYMNPDSDVYEIVEKGKYVIGDYVSLTKKIFKLVAFQYMPHQMKKYFYVDTAEFEELKVSSQADRKSYSERMETFYSDMENDPYRLREENCFRLYHLDGVHAPYTFDPSFVKDKSKTYDVLDEAAGSLYLLNCFIEKLKEYQIYENSTIIVMSDHGDIQLAQNPLFMIKNRNENHEFAISKQKMSYGYLQMLFCDLLRESSADEARIRSYYDEIDRRRFLYYSWNNSWDKQYLPRMIEFVAQKDMSTMEP